jgi:hypothetical protein
LGIAAGLTACCGSLRSDSPPPLDFLGALQAAAAFGSVPAPESSVGQIRLLAKAATRRAESTRT